jgi:DNA end-binding protein Ku
LPKRTTHAVESDDERASSRPFWSGTITFGLVSVPVDLYPATHSSHVGLRMIGPSGQPLARRYFSAKSDKELGDDDIVRGYEVKKNKFVVVTDEELEKLAPEKSRDIDLKRFVDISSISPMYFEHAYFLAPASQSVKAYRLLAEVMERTGQAGIATFVMRGKEYLVAILAENGILRAETLRFADELRAPREIGLPKPVKPARTSVRRFATLIQKKSKKSLPRTLMQDEQSRDLERYAARKLKARPAAAVESEGETSKPADVVDIMSVLKKSLERRAA